MDRLTLTYWTEQVCIYDDNIDSTEKLSDEAKWQFLENTVQNYTKLHTVYSTEDVFTVIGFRPLAYQQYCDPLQSAAQRYDETMSRTKKP